MFGKDLTSVSLLKKMICKMKARDATCLRTFSIILSENVPSPKERMRHIYSYRNIFALVNISDLKKKKKSLKTFRENGPASALSLPVVPPHTYATGAVDRN